MKWLRNPSVLWQNGYSLIRIFLGITLIYHGSEVFDVKKMTDYGKWLTELHFVAPALMGYLGKGSELVAGILFTIGLFTRASCLLLIFTFLSITFFIGHGRILMEDQHPFLYVLFSLIYLFEGPGKLSIDAYITNGK